MMKRAPWFQLLISLGIAFLAAGMGSLFTTPNLEPWYSQLEKPWFNPPNWIFGPVWTTLFILMAVAAWLVWQHGQTKKKKLTPPAAFGLKLYAVQLGLNVLWSGLFFGLQSPQLALVEVFIFWLVIIATAREFWRVKPLAGALFIPYIAWVSFASVLNYAVVLLN